MRHPIERISPESQGAFAGWGVMACLLVGLPLIAVIESGPGIVALVRLVFAGSSGSADTLLESWSASDRLCIAFANGLDYLFGILLFGTLALGCVRAARRLSSPRLRSFSVVLVWLASLAVILDVPIGN